MGSSDGLSWYLGTAMVNAAELPFCGWLADSVCR